MKSLFSQRGAPCFAMGALIVLAVGCGQGTVPNTKIVAVNEGAKTITAVKGDEQVTYDVAPDANITLDDKPAELKALSAGDHMNVELKEKGGLSVAMRIEATSQEKIPTDDTKDTTPSPVPIY